MFRILLDFDPIETGKLTEQALEEQQALVPLPPSAAEAEYFLARLRSGEWEGDNELEEYHRLQGISDMGTFKGVFEFIKGVFSGTTVSTTKNLTQCQINIDGVYHGGIAIGTYASNRDFFGMLD